MAALDVIASELLKSAREADLNYKKTRDLTQRDKAIRLRKIVENLKLIPLGATDLNGLSDVLISAPANAQVLTYNSSTSQWENQTPGTGTGVGDMDKSTYDVDNDGIVDGAETIQIIVRNSTGSTLTKGQVVYLSGATGNRPNAVLSKADTEATSSKTIGIVIANIANNSDGYVAVNGTLHDLDTSAFADGAAVWLSATTAGAFTSTIPAEPNHTVFIGYVARSHPTQGRLVILIQNGYELNELHGVLVTSEANNDLLVYESSTGLWKNKTFTAIFGGTPLVSVPTLAAVTTAGNTTTNAITVGGLIVDTTTLVVDSANDRVGINTSTPFATLTVNGIIASGNNLGTSGGSTFPGELRSYQQNPSPLYLSLQTTSAGNGKSGLFRSNTDYILYYDLSTGDTVVNSSFLNSAIKFTYQNSEKARMFSTGNWVIQNGGTFTDAGYRLDVQGNTRVNGGNTTSDIPFIINNRFQFRGDGVLSYGNAAGHGRLTWDNSGAYFNGLSGYGVGLGANGVLNHLFINTSGNVGIGTITPNQKLTVSGIIEAGNASATAGTVTLYQAYASPNYLGSMSTEWGSGAMILGYGAVGKSGVAGFVSTFANFTGLRAAIRLGQGTVSIFSSLTAVNTAVGSDLTMTETVRISESGSVGIGTASPQTKLHLASTNSSIRIDTSLSNSAFLTGWQDAVAIGVNRDPQNGNFTNTAKAAASIFLYGQANSSFINFSTTTSNNILPTERMRLESSGNLLINTTTDSGYKLNVNGTAYIGGVATLNSDANVAGSIATPQITARRYYQNPNGVPSNNLGDPTITEMALFDEQFDNKTAFYPNIYGSSILTFETYDGTTWTDISSTLTDTQKKQLFGGDNSSSIAIPYGTVQYQITINNPGPYVYLNALYNYWSSNGHSTQIHIWKKHNSGSWVQHTNSTTTVSSWPGHAYLPFSTIPWHPSGTLGVHYHQIRIVYTPTWNATYPTNSINLYKLQMWGGYPAGKRAIYSTNENRGVGFPADVTATGAITSGGTFTANSTSTFAQLATFNNGISSRSATPTITFDRNSSYIWRLIVGDGTTYPTSTLNVVNNAGTAITTFLDSGNVGIGTTSPAVTLNVQNGGSTPKAVFQHGTLAHLGVLIGSTGGGFAIEDNNYFAIWHQDYTNRGTETGITERLRITTGGNLLIGTTTDSGYKLDVAGTARVTNGIYFSNSSGSFLWELGAYALRFGTNNTERMRIDSSGNVGVGTTSPYDKLEVNGAISATGAAVANSAQTHATTLSVESGVSYLYAVDWGVEYKPLGVRAQTISLQTGGGSTTDRLFINSTGNVGIGTTSPTARLQVEGSIAATSAIARGTYLNQTLVAAANNDSLVALDINPTFTVGAFTGVISSAIRFPNQTYITTANTTGSFYNVFGTDSNGTLRVGHIGLNTALFGANMSLTGNSVVRFVSNGGTNFVYVYTGTTGNVVLQNGGTFTDAGYRLDVNGTARVQSNFTVDTDTLYVDATNNRVGIGTATPTDKLHIIDSNNANIFGRITATGTNASAAWVAMNNQNDNVVYRVFGDGVSGSQMGISLVRSASLMANLGGSGAFLIGTYSGTDLVFGVQNSECMRIANNTGNVLIGTNVDNGYMLDVAGTINGNSFSVGGIGGWTGTITIITNPPGQQNIQVNSGIITNVF